MAPKSSDIIHSDEESSGDEGAIKNLDYKPPKDFTLHKAKSSTTSAFDVDETVKHELWLIRVPEGVSNEDLATMSISLPPSTSSSSVSLGSLKKKEITTKSATSTTIKYQLQTVAPESGFAGEMLALQALVPDSSQKGRLVQAPLGIKHHLALMTSPSIPSGEPLADEILSRPIPKREQPEGLKMRFKVSGFDTQVPGAKLSGSGKEFAARWAKTLEKRQQEQEALERARQAAEEEDENEDEDEDEEEEEEAEVEAQTEVDGSEQGSNEVSAAVEEEEEEEVEEEVEEEEVEEEEEKKEEKAKPSKKRKGEQMDVVGTEEKKAKKEKKEKKEKKPKKEKKNKK